MEQLQFIKEDFISKITDLKKELEALDIYCKRQDQIQQDFRDEDNRAREAMLKLAQEGY